MVISCPGLRDVVRMISAADSRRKPREDSSINPSVDDHIPVPPDLILKETELDEQYDTLEDVMKEKQVIRSKVHSEMGQLCNACEGRG